MKRNNKGYSFVETIIVIAIIVILAGLSLVSVTLINTARAKQASTLFGDEVKLIKQKNMSMAPQLDSAVYSSGTKSSYGLVLHKEDGKFKLTEVECAEQGSGSTSYYKYVYNSVGSTDVKRVDTASIASAVDVKFSGYYKSFEDGSDNSGSEYTDYVAGQLDSGSTNSICILFDKKGNCISGYGTYSFYKKNGTQVSSVIVRKNGSIEIR